MFAKIFSQIFDSSIADDYQARHVFMDLLVLADSDGVVDMTPGAIARRTNVPQEIIEEGLIKLCRPDPDSRTKTDGGRRILPIDETRGWGWQIVNYHHYRRIRDEESRREYYREYRREEREKKRPKKTAKKKLTIEQKADLPPADEHRPADWEIAPPGEAHSGSFEQFQNGTG